MCRLLHLMDAFGRTPLLRDWFAQHRYGNATTGDFMALADQDSHRNPRAFFDKWLFTPGPVVTAASTRGAAAGGSTAARLNRRH